MGPHDRDDDFMTHEPPELQRLHGVTQDREITLSSGFILGIFFALALLCAVVFAMGYTLGRRSQQSQTLADSSTTGANFSSFKPSPQSIAVQPAASVQPAAETTPADTTAQPTVQPISSPAAAPVNAPPAAAPPPARTAPVAPPAAAAQATPMVNIVQVAAVSHQEDADVLLSALRRKGYAVTARTEPQDKLIHIQVGPFPTRKDADEMRQRLLTDGYNAIVK
jgi:cell division septation protein DedD